MPEPEMTEEQIQQINYEMAEGIIHEVMSLIEQEPCLHEKKCEVSPPMMLREAVMCVLAARDKKIAELQQQLQNEVAVRTVRDGEIKVLEECLKKIKRQGHYYCGIHEDTQMVIEQEPATRMYCPECEKEKS